MAFEELKESTEDIQKNAKEFIDNNVAYYKLRGFKIAIKSTSMVIKFLLIAISLTLVLLLFSIAAAFAIGDALDSYALGFLIIGGFYLIVTGLLFLIKDKIVEGPILEIFSEIFFND